MRLHVKSAALAAALAFLTLALAACNGDSDGDDDGDSTPAPAAATGASTPTSSCVPVNDLPQEGSGPEDLEGQITYVRLVFGCQPDIAIMDANGSNARLIANHEALDDESDLSPDRSRVVFFSGREGTARIYVMNADGSEVEALTQGGGGDTSPRWSPDGSRIAFSRGSSIAVMNADGSDVRIVMQASQGGEIEACKAGSFVGSWSPDGQRILYYTAVLGSGGLNKYWICAVNADGASPPEVLVDEPADKLHAEPYWAPDGNRIAFRDDRDGNCAAGGSECNYDIYVKDLVTGVETNVTNHPSLDIEPAWSPDSEWIVFASNREDPNFDLYVIHPDGTGLQRLLADPASKDSYPSWR